MTGRWLCAAGSLLFLMPFAVPHSAGAANGVIPTLKFVETLRKERLTVRDDDLFVRRTQRQEAEAGKFTLDAVVPIAVDDVAALNEATEVSIRAGAFEYTGRLGDDPEFDVGRTRARLVCTQLLESGTRVNLPPDIRLEWDRNRLKVHAEGKTPHLVKALAAREFIARGSDTVEGTLPVTIRFGTTGLEFQVPFKGKVKTTEGMRDDVEYFVSTVDLRGEGRLKP